MQPLLFILFLPLIDALSLDFEDTQEYGQVEIDSDPDKQDKQSSKPYSGQDHPTISHPQSTKTKNIDFNVFDPDFMDPDSLRDVIDDLTSQANQVVMGVQPIDVPEDQNSASGHDTLDTVPVCDPLINTCCDGTNFLWGLAISGCERFSLGKLKCRFKNAVFCCRKLRFDWGWRCFPVYSSGKGGNGKGKENKEESTERSNLDIGTVGSTD